VNTNFAGPFVVGQDLDGAITSPKAITFEGGGFLVFIKTIGSLCKKVFKVIDFKFFAGLAKGGLGAGFSSCKNFI
jgi:hypothetical protein